jgi:hypothetical protein
MKEKVLTYKIPQHVVNNTLLFLKRTTLTGEESFSWVEIVKYLSNPVQKTKKIK